MFAGRRRGGGAAARLAGPRRRGVRRVGQPRRREGQGVVGPRGVSKVLGYDASGVVVQVGSDVELFAVADEVYYAGSIARSGSNAGLQLVDERVVGHKPSSLDFAEAAALPLTTITAWEALFDKLGLERDA